jgi:hypothetical protein
MFSHFLRLKSPFCTKSKNLKFPPFPNSTNKCSYLTSSFPIIIWSITLMIPRWVMEERGFASWGIPFISSEIPGYPMWLGKSLGHSNLPLFQLRRGNWSFFRTAASLTYCPFLWKRKHSFQCLWSHYFICWLCFRWSNYLASPGRDSILPSTYFNKRRTGKRW